MTAFIGKRISRKIIAAIVTIFACTTLALIGLQYVLYARGFGRIMATVAQATGELRKADAADLMLEVKTAVEGSLQRGEYAKFESFAEKQKDLKEIRGFHFYGRDGRILLSSDASARGRAIDPQVWARAGESRDMFFVETGDVLDMYEPLRVDADMRRLNPDWKTGELYGVLQMSFSKDRIRDALAKAESLYASIRGRIYFYVLAASLAATACVVIVSSLVARRISGPLRDAQAVMSQIAAGDLTRRIEVRTHDEVGALARSLNGMAETLQQMVRGIVEDARTLAQAAEGLNATATDLAEGARQTTGRSASVADASRHMSESMHAAAAASEQMGGNVKTVAAAVEELTTSITEVARSAEQAAGVAENASRLAEASNGNVTSLGSAADEIGKVIAVIQDIAEQTNLLALNATIEAARAGEAGKGFAVVAGEVKELARQTAEATDDIRRRIEGIQSSVSETVNSIEQIGGVIRNINDYSRTIASAVEEQSITTREIAQNIAQTATAATGVAEGVAQAAGMSQEISRNIAEVDAAAQQTAQGAGRTQSAGREMAQIAGRLREMVRRFTV